MVQTDLLSNKKVVMKPKPKRRKKIRRKVYSLDYFNAGGRERRRNDRRKS